MMKVFRLLTVIQVNVKNIYGPTTLLRKSFTHKYSQ